MREKTKVIRVYESDYEIFKDYCQEHGFIMTGLVSVIIREYMKNKIAGGSADDTIPKRDGK